jgi:hypothetical protein
MDRDDELRQVEAELARLDAERSRVQARIAALRSDRRTALSAEERVALFESLFRGREDVYATRWERATTGRSGYAPACRNERVAGICGKPKVRCGACPNQSFRPLTSVVLRAHLQGQITVGVYPLRADERCWFVAIDLDGAAWRDDAIAVREAATTIGAPTTIERSRSGDGAHAWTFFAEPVRAIDARQLAFAMLTEASARRNAIGLASYDRVFPNQDVMPAGGFGNLIALPLQRAAREGGYSVFLDERLEPYVDQWQHLAAVERVTKERLEQLLSQAARRSGGILGVADTNDDTDEPWHRRRASQLSLTSDLPATVTATLRQQIYIPRSGLSARAAPV